MRLSVVIPTLNRPDVVLRTVRDHLAQAHEDFEVIVVDGSATPNDALAGLATQDKRLQVINTPNRGTCYSRNTGVAAASGEIVVFTDDDVEISDRQFLTHHANCYADSTIGGVGGKTVDKNEQLNREQSGPVCYVTPTGRIFGRANSDQRQDINAPRGANMSYRKEIIAQVGGFDERFRGNAMREETDFSLRVVKAGWRIKFEPSASLVHIGATGGGSRTADRLQWYRDFFFNEFYFFRKHFSPFYLPLLFWRKARAMGACWLWYGKGKWSWFMAPWQAWRDATRALHQQ
jgi:GT2 family glycosyltransferase